MELRVETADGTALPKGCFVSVRVGDVQKQRRYENKGAFQFPAPAHSRKAKIDLYQHVGTCSISVGPEDRISEVNVQPLEANGPRACLKVQSTLKQEAVVDRQTKMSNVKKEAVEYLSKWLIQERLGEAVKALLQKRPDDPIEFICGFLRANSAAMSAPTSPTSPAAPAPAKQKQPEAVPVLPFKPYYQSNMIPQAASVYAGLYAKFAPQQQAVMAKKDELNQVRDKARVALEKAFLSDDEEEQPAKAARPPPVQAQAPPREIPDWLKAGSPPQGFGVYYKENLEAAMPHSPWGTLFAKFNDKAVAPPAPLSPQKQAAAPQAAKPAAAAAATPQGPTFNVQPSVGTWLARRPVPPVVQKGTLPTHLKASWDLQGMRPASCMCVDERVEVERIVANALLELSGSLEGEYLPLQTSTSYPARPGGMSDSERSLLLAGGLLMQANDALGRGVFVNNCSDVAVWVNGSHHVQLIVKQEQISPEEALMKLRAAEKALSQALKQEGHDLAGPVASSTKRLTGLNAPGVMSVDERCEVERVCARAFLELTGELEGEYFPMPSSMSYPPRPGGMSASEESALSGHGLILGSSNAIARGVFKTALGDLAVVVNGESHIQFLTTCRKMSESEAKVKIQNIESCVRDALRQSGYDYA